MDFKNENKSDVLSIFGSSLRKGGLEFFSDRENFSLSSKTQIRGTASIEGGFSHYEK